MDGDKVGFVWSIADLLRGDFRRHEYGQVILPFLVLRRLDCALAPTKQAVTAKAEQIGSISNPGPILTKVAKQPFYNVSPLDLESVLGDPANVAANLRTYIAGFSPGASQVLSRYGFDATIADLNQAGLLFQVLARFVDLDLRPSKVSNHEMGYIFEELLRRFSEMSNETAGEHFTPREVIALMVNILFSEDDDALTGSAPVRTMYDPACGTGGMLTGGQEHLAALNPNARLEVFGQELNPETWAIARSDLMIKGQNPDRIVLGNSLSDDGHTGQRFDYMLANPPFGVEWKKIEKTIRDEAAGGGRFAAGLPRISDGSLLFLQHMISKMKPVDQGGSRIAIVFSGSPLFSGGAGSGESEIRRWIIENDWLEAIVGLPDQMFYNTSISTYFWIVTNRKTDDRKGKVALIDARGEWTRMRKSLGDKRKQITEAQIDEITRTYHEALELDGHDDRVKIVANEDLGYQRITVERPLRRRWELTTDAIDAVMAAKPVLALDDEQTQALRAALDDLVGITENTETAFGKRLGAAVVAHSATIPLPVRKAILGVAAIADPGAPVTVGKDKQPLPDPDLRDQENVPLAEGIDTYLDREVLPHVPDAWADETKTKIGYEIPFTRYFYRYTPPRALADIDADIARVEAEIKNVLNGVVK